MKCNTVKDNGETCGANSMIHMCPIHLLEIKQDFDVEIAKVDELQKALQSIADEWFSNESLMNTASGLLMVPQNETSRKLSDFSFTMDRLLEKYVNE